MSMQDGERMKRIEAEEDTSDFGGIACCECGCDVGKECKVGGYMFNCLLLMSGKRTGLCDMCSSVALAKFLCDKMVIVVK